MSGTRLLAEGRVWEAVLALRAATAAQPQDPIVRATLAQALRAHGARDEALHHAMVALRLAPAEPAMHRLVAGLLLLVGDVSGAVSRWRLSIALGGGRVSHFQLGVALRFAGDPAAVHHFQRALEASDEPALPPLLRARVEGALHDAQSGRVWAMDLCSAPLVTELFGEAPAEVAQAPSVASAPFRSVSPEGLAGAWGGSPRVVALTGAGISRSSGLATRKELWRRYSRDEAVSVWRFREHPEELWRVVADFLGGGAPEPSEAHRALAQVPGLVGVLTQNVDGLHQAAGTAVGRSGEVVELHGSLDTTRCHECGRPGEAAVAYVRRGELPPMCGCGGAIRPDVVLFGEPVLADRLARAKALVAQCDRLVVVGCAMDVAPAAELPRFAMERGARVVEVKRNPSRLSSAIGTEVLLGAAEDVLPAFIRALGLERV